MSSEATADQVAERTLSVPGVEALHAGVLGEVATYLPGRRVNGVRLTEDACEVHVVLAWGAAVRQTAEDVRSHLADLVDVPVTVTVEDVAPPS